MRDGSPSKSWYDPPEPKYNLEIKWERPVTDNQAKCDKCEEAAYMHVQVNDVRRQGGAFHYICKDHYETIIEDTIEEYEDYEPDYEED